MPETRIPEPAANPADGAVDANYEYWRAHGGEWTEQYDSRKKRMVLYHIQELMLTTYIEQHGSTSAAPLKVLEFGCGVGRHLHNLSRLPNVEIHGYDQSRAMAEGVLRWASREWFEERVRVGMPTGRLPYEDGAFDIVYTAEVLVHVRPEHLEGVLSELGRVCRGHVLHLETSPDYPVVSDEHSGCWKHDLPATYAKLGRECEVLPGGYLCHTPYRVVVGAAPSWVWPRQVLEMYRRLERDIDEGFAAADAELRAQIAANARQAEALAAANERIAELERAVAEQSARASAAEDRALAAKTHAAGLESAVKLAAAENESLRRHFAEMAAARDEAVRQVQALHEHLARVESGWAGDRDALRRMIEEKQEFIARVTHLLGASFGG
jgi:SAM-dependent methyltransferase